MVTSRLEEVSLRGIACAVPKAASPLALDAERFGVDALKKVTESTGITSRRIAPPGMRTSDLGVAAAQSLLSELGWEPESVSLLVVATQTPDYEMPATSNSLQCRLGIPKGSAALDIALGCSGYPYGLWATGSLLRATSGSRALLVVGDTLTKRVSRDDRTLWPLFGDAVSATALEMDTSASPIQFDLGSDGRGQEDLIIMRADNVPDVNPGTLTMHGPAVFSFALREVPAMVRRVLTAADISTPDVDRWVFHQANALILRTLQKRLSLEDEKFVIDLAEWGNTSGASIPLALAAAIRSSKPVTDVKTMLVGFGVGLSWGAALLDISPDTVACAPIEVEA